MSINRVIISGNLTRDAELRNAQSGTAIVNFRVAVNSRKKNPQTDEWEDYPNFIDVVWFGSRAEKCIGYLTKGAKVCIDGALRYTTWEKDGQKRSKVEVVVNEIELPKKQEPQQDLYAADVPF